MKFVYFGYDFMLHAVTRLMGEGHELAGIFTFECDNVFNFNRETIALGESLGIPVSMTAPRAEEIENFIASGTQAFLAAGYLFKIPHIDETRAYGLNVHPSLLPMGRGIMPTPYILLDHPDAAGFTIHKITDHFDAGDILYQEELPLKKDETVESLSGRTAMRVPAALSNVFKDLPGTWAKARPQNEAQATYFPAPNDQMRTLDWALPTARLAAIARAFGRYGSLAHVEGDMLVVYAMDAWPENHRMKPGHIACRMSREMIVAASDGFVCLKDFEVARL